MIIIKALFYNSEHSHFDHLELQNYLESLGVHMNAFLDSSRGTDVVRNHQTSMLQKCFDDFDKILKLLAQRLPFIKSSYEEQERAVDLLNLLKGFQNHNINHLADALQLDDTILREIINYSNEGQSPVQLLIIQIHLIIQQVCLGSLSNQVKYYTLNVFIQELKTLMMAELHSKDLEELIVKLSSDASIDQFENLLKKYLISPYQLQQIRYFVEEESLSSQETRLGILALLITFISQSNFRSKEKEAVLQFLTLKNSRQLQQLYNNKIEYFFSLIINEHQFEDLELQGYLSIFGISYSDYRSMHKEMLRFASKSRTEMESNVAHLLYKTIQRSTFLTLQTSILHFFKTTILDNLSRLDLSVRRLPVLLDHIISDHVFVSFQNLSSSYGLSNQDIQYIRQTVSRFPVFSKKSRTIKLLEDIFVASDTLQFSQKQVYLTELEKLERED